MIDKMSKSENGEIQWDGNAQSRSFPIIPFSRFLGTFKLDTCSYLEINYWITFDLFDKGVT